MQGQSVPFDIWWALYVAWVASEFVLLVLTRTPGMGGRSRDRGSLLVLWPTIVGALIAGTWFGATHRHTMFGGAGWVPRVSAVVLAVGLAVRWAAVATLGRSFSVNVAIHAKQTLHRGGLFRVVRHPSYTGLMLILAAIGMHTRNWIGFGITVVPAAGALLYRMHVEEAALRAAFGQEYEEYSRTTKRVIPLVY